MLETCKKQLRGVAQLVAHLVWDQGVAGSNPVTPTTERQKKQSRGVVSRPGWCEPLEQMKPFSGCSAVGSASGLGPGGRRFESCHPDEKAVFKANNF